MKYEEEKIGSENTLICYAQSVVTQSQLTVSNTSFYVMILLKQIRCLLVAGCAMMTCSPLMSRNR